MFVNFRLHLSGLQKCVDREMVYGVRDTNGSGTGIRINYAKHF